MTFAIVHITVAVHSYIMLLLLFIKHFFMAKVVVTSRHVYLGLGFLSFFAPNASYSQIPKVVRMNFIAVPVHGLNIEITIDH